jgi:hypothetical protein
VKGRIRKLKISIIGRNRAKPTGVPYGSKWATKEEN